MHFEKESAVHKSMERIVRRLEELEIPYAVVGAMALFSYVSLGGVTFYEGFFEVDLMNYYTARLTAYSQSTVLAMLLGWHVWSVARGIGYLILTIEIMGFSLARMTGRVTLPRRGLWVRLGAGVAIVLADGVLKFLLLEPVRTALAQNLQG